MAEPCVAMNEDLTPVQALERDNCCRCHRTSCAQAASQSWLQASASHETHAIHPPISSAYSGLTCMEMQRMWSSSLTHTRNVLSLLWKMPRASGQSRAAPQLASTLLGVGFWNRKPSACAIGCQDECSVREETRGAGRREGLGHWHAVDAVGGGFWKEGICLQHTRQFHRRGESAVPLLQA